jgi:hypothetical protein
MKYTALVLSLCVSLAAAGVVITPIKPDQVVEKSSGDCFFGVTTPQGCGYVRFLPAVFAVMFNECYLVLFGLHRRGSSQMRWIAERNGSQLLEYDGA